VRPGIPILVALVAALPWRALSSEPARTPAPAGPVPVPYPNVVSATARDAAGGLATGKRIHKPFAPSAFDRKIRLADGRVFLSNSRTGEVVFGDGTEGKRPPTGEVPPDGKYRTGGGAAGDVEVRAGRIVTPVPTPAVAKAPARTR
jgi:hypothetical protein